MPNPRDFLPRPPWEGPPVPRILQQSNPTPYKEAEEKIRKWLRTTSYWHIRRSLYEEYPEVEPYAREILERMAARGEVELVEDIDAAWIDYRGRTIAHAFPAGRR